MSNLVLREPQAEKSTKNSPVERTAPVKIKRFKLNLPKLYPAQSEAIEGPERYGIIEASTKSGKTLGCIIWLLNEAHQSGMSGRIYWWVAPIFSQARIAYRRMKLGLTKPNGETGFLKANDGELSIILKNHARIAFKGADNPDSLYGEDVYAAVIDEASRMKEEAWIAIRSTVTATQGPVRIIGNVKGKKNWAYRLARRAELGEPNWKYSKLTAFDAVGGGVLTQEEIEDARRTLPHEIFKELYLAEASDDAGNPFGLESIANCTAPMSIAEPYVWGWDLAKSYDWTVGIALDKDGAVCRFERFQRDWDYTEDYILRVIGDDTALIDSTGVGDPIVERLQKQRSSIQGFKFTAQSKQQLMEGLVVGIQNKDIVFPDNEIVVELESFEYTYTRTGAKYEAPSGIHDDCVMALALALKGYKDIPVGFGVW